MTDTTSAPAPVMAEQTLEGLREQLDYARGGIEHADAAYHPHALAAVDVARKLLVELEATRDLITPTLLELTLERARQDAKWGEQNHPDGTGPDVLVAGNLGAPRAHELARDFRLMCQRAAREGRTTWRGILLEEVFEAIATADPAELAAELVQVAAVCVNWIDAIGRRS